MRDKSDTIYFMELVVLVDEQNNVLGTASKDTVHGRNTPLHRAVSLFLFNSKKELLLTKRASTKKTFPGIWTNTICGHPAPGESEVDAAMRRLKAELGIEGSDRSKGSGLEGFKGLTQTRTASIRVVATYRYRFADKNGIVENEICPILVGFTDTNPTPNSSEVSDWKWVRWEDFLEEIKINPSSYSPWSIEEAHILEEKKLVQ